MHCHDFSEGVAGKCKYEGGCNYCINHHPWASLVARLSLSMPVVDGVNNLFASLAACSSLSTPVVDVANNSAPTMKHGEAEKGEKAHMSVRLREFFILDTCSTFRTFLLSFSPVVVHKKTCKFMFLLLFDKRGYYRHSLLPMEVTVMIVIIIIRH